MIPKYPGFMGGTGATAGGGASGAGVGGSSNPPGLVRIQPKPGGGGGAGGGHPQHTTPPPYHRMPPHLVASRVSNEVAPTPSVSSTTHPMGMDSR